MRPQVDTVRVLRESSLGHTVCNSDNGLYKTPIRAAHLAAVAVIVMKDRRNTFIYVCSTRLVSYYGGTLEEKTDEEDVLRHWQMRKFNEEVVQERSEAQLSKPVATSNGRGIKTTVFLVHHTDGEPVDVLMPGTMNNYTVPGGEKATKSAHIRGSE